MSPVPPVPWKGVLAGVADCWEVCECSAFWSPRTVTWLPETVTGASAPRPVWLPEPVPSEPLVWPPEPPEPVLTEGVPPPSELLGGEGVPVAPDGDLVATDGDGEVDLESGLVARDQASGAAGVVC